MYGKSQRKRWAYVAAYRMNKDTAKIIGYSMQYMRPPFGPNLISSITSSSSDEIRSQISTKMQGCKKGAQYFTWT